jgi:hypothetical protein
MRLILDHVWLAADGRRTINPLNQVGRPEHFGPGTELPHTLDASSRLTQTPTTSQGWVTGFAPELSEEALLILKPKLEEKLRAMDFIVSLPA